MGLHDLYFPALAQACLTFILMIWMGRTRLHALANEKVRVSQIALGQRAWPEPVQRVSNAYHNQFELPVLFYAVLLFAIHFNYISALFLIFAWGFVFLRLAHAYFHTSGRNIRYRFLCFTAGASILACMWALLTVHVALRFS